jgi:RHH-type proline utilization regulon transcriptional repressor/proline dehydrogenase/delta 1-pyrroline-5-carboxylate dehydrogenase
MLENSSNSGFVQQLGNPNISAQRLAESPVHILQRTGHDQNPAIRRPVDLFGRRRNSEGLDLFDRHALQALNACLQQFKQSAPLTAQPVGPPTTVSSDDFHMQPVDVLNPADPDDVIGQVIAASSPDVTQAIAAAHEAVGGWSLKPVTERAACLERMADLLQENREPLMALLIREAGKTRSDALSEVREAIDFCRYYAEQARELMTEQVLPGPSGEFNALTLRARGVFGCISPWNFPLAIFMGQIAAALVTGNGVIAKPAPQTPLIAAFAMRLLHQAGVPATVAALLPGGPQVGAQIVRDRRMPVVLSRARRPPRATSRKRCWKIRNDR